MEDATPTPDTPAPGQPSPGQPAPGTSTGNGTSVGEMIITRPRAPADFDLQSDFAPAGDQPTAIKELVEGIRNGERDQVLLGVTGSGKTFTAAHVIRQIKRPTLILAPNKTLAAQLYGEMKALFPDNAVEYFVSYYDYYQPEAYVPQRDLFIEKDTALNDELDRLRLSATRSILERKDVVIVSSVSCIYGLGDPEEYGQMLLYLRQGDRYRRGQLLERLVEIRYERNDYDFHRGTFRVRGDVIEIYMAEAEYAVRVELWGDEIESISNDTNPDQVPVLIIEDDPVPTPEPEKIIVIATPTPDVQKTEMNSNESIVTNESGGCGGGSSSISLFSVLVSILGVLLFKKSRKHHNSVI